MKKVLTKYFILAAPFLLLIFGLLIHLYHLTAFPVFADEAIYIRWAQLAMDDWGRYLFFSLNDGKTPLFIWLLIPFQYLGHLWPQIMPDQLFAARTLSVIVGLLQAYVMKLILKKMGLQPKWQWLGAFLTLILPFWYFQAHLALMDGMLTLFLMLTFWGLLQIVNLSAVNPVKLFNQRTIWLWICVTGIFYGLAFWTKLPALFFLPIFPLMIFWPSGHFKIRERLNLLFPLGAVAFIGLVIFAMMRISPGFGQLFRRSGDFAYPVSDVLIHGLWRQTLPNIPSYISYFFIYLTPSIVLLSLAGLFSQRSRRRTIMLLLAAVIMSAPFAIFGKMIYSRYLFPSAIFVTIAAVVNLEAIKQHWINEAKANQFLTKLVAGLIIALLLANTIASSFVFINSVLFSPDQTPLASSDRAQYLEDWSSGQGIWETAQYIKQQAKSHTIAVATEGRFGTLPDGLLLYFHDENVQNVYIEGTGQYPVKSLPDFFVNRAKNFSQSILVVNSDRMELSLPSNRLLNQYCRPNHKSCLQVWDITPEVKK